jgi:hypothetical protein
MGQYPLHVTTGPRWVGLVSKAGPEPWPLFCPARSSLHAYTALEKLVIHIAEAKGCCLSVAVRNVECIDVVPRMQLERWGPQTLGSWDMQVPGLSCSITKAFKRKAWTVTGDHTAFRCNLA